MSKMDGLRAMREARYEAAQKGKKTAAPRPKAETTGATPTAKAKAKAKPKATPVPAEAGTEELCGHKAISGRTCTREKGHSAKSHRYA